MLICLLAGDTVNRRETDPGLDDDIDGPRADQAAYLTVCRVVVLELLRSKKNLVQCVVSYGRRPRQCIVRRELRNYSRASTGGPNNAW
jgi:hypothetical protein